LAELFPEKIHELEKTPDDATVRGDFKSPPVMEYA
jgi:hypothetical protein